MAKSQINEKYNALQSPPEDNEEEEMEEEDILNFTLPKPAASKTIDAPKGSTSKGSVAKKKGESFVIHSI